MRDDSLSVLISLLPAMLSRTARAISTASAMRSPRRSKLAVTMPVWKR